MADLAKDLESQYDLLEAELAKVQDQISCLLEHQGRLLEQKYELLRLINTCKVSEHESVLTHEDTKSQCQEDWAGSFDWDKQARNILLNVFAMSSFRPNQREIINAVLSGRDVVVIMAAGGGKSLCYQLPALIRPGVTLVVSPLLSLIQDQVMGLAALKISARMLNSNTPKEEESSIYKFLEKGEGDSCVLYVTPEKIAKSKRFMSKLEKCNHGGRLSLLAIDEAHCCSQWGHDFRPDYKNLGILKQQFSKVPLIALTATATERVQNDLKEMLHLSACEKFVSSINRPNLFYEVRDKKSNASGVIDDIANFIQDNYSKNDSGIIYCFSRRECEQVARELQQRKISAAYYHADMDATARESVHRRWSGDKLQVIVGTIAFGMGINKPDVRFVIHHSLSKSLETYYQESGRAGRDGLPAHCLLLFRPADLPRQSAMVFAEVAGLQNLYDITRYCQSKRTCRRGAFFQHFGEKLQACNGMCDNCAFSRELIDVDVTAHSKSIVNLVNELNSLDKKVTLLQLVGQWKNHNRRLGKSNEDKPGMPKELNKDEVEHIIVQLVLAGHLKEEFQHSPYATNAYVTIGSRCNRLLQEKDKVILEVHSSEKVMKHASSSVYGPVNEDILQSEMAHMLDRLRRELASAHGGIFPYAILSSQHIGLLCLRKPQNLTQIEEVIGKQKAELYGKEILASLRKFAENLELSISVGKWTSPKNSCSQVGSKEKRISGVNNPVMTPKQSFDTKNMEKRKSSYINLENDRDGDDNDDNIAKNSKNSDSFKGKRLRH